MKQFPTFCLDNYKDLKCNFHTHTTRCKHAIGTEREYVENAIKAGYQVLGFSDHAPYPYPDPEPYYIAHTMKLHELEDYCATVLALREEYKNDIQIYFLFLLVILTIR